MNTRAGMSIVLLSLACAAGCGDDDGPSPAPDGGDQDSGAGDSCPNVAGNWTIDEHCGGAPLIGMRVPVTQSGCDFTTGGAFAGFTGSVDGNGDFSMSGVASGQTVTCTGTATPTLITESCTGNCDVVLSQ